MNIHSKYSIIYLYIKYRHTSKRLATMPTRLFPLNARMFNISNTKNVINHISGLKDENLVIISIDANKKHLCQNKFTIKVLENIVLNGTYLNIIRAIYAPYSQHHLKWRKLETILLKS